MLTLTPLAIAEVLVVTPDVYPDARGYFFEAWNAATFSQAGLEQSFVQDNVSFSQRGTLRGLHYQIEQPQGKLVRALVGTIFDVAVDVRRGSPTFGAWVGAELSAENHRALWVPPGFAHGFLVTSSHALISYKCTTPYHRAHERAIVWNDAELAIDWPTDGAGPLLSPKDAAAPTFRDAEVFA
jgi:dTDP-4-dehydrorhamnose 3,5-epimerase